MFAFNSYLPFNRFSYAQFGDAYKISRLPTRCCGCFPNWTGSVLGCLFMSGFSFYFAVTSFMQQSPFFSYLAFAPMIVFGVINLIYGLATFITLIILIRPWMNLDRPLAYLLGFLVASVIIDTFANVIYVSSNGNDFINSCMADGLAQVENNLPPGTTITLPNDYFNCSRLFHDEIKWSLGCAILMFLLYTHWTVFIASFIGKMDFRLGVQPGMGPATAIPTMEAVQPMFNIPRSDVKPNHHLGETMPSEKVLIAPMQSDFHIVV